MADLQKVVKLTSSQYSTLAGGGTVGSYTGLDSSYLYLVEDSTQYVPLGGTTSLYGSIVPSTNDSIALGNSNRGFASLYAKNILYPGDMSIIANYAIVGQGAGGTLSLDAGSSVYITANKNISIYAGSYIYLSASGNVNLSASGFTALYASGSNYIYGGSKVRIWTGSLAGYQIPYIEMWLSGGYYPNVDISASLSGMGNINLNAGEDVNIYGENNIRLSTSGNIYLTNTNTNNGIVNVYCPSGNFTFRGCPVVVGWQHNIVLSSTNVVISLQLITSKSTSMTTTEEVWQVLYDRGFSTAYRQYPVSGFGRFTSNGGVYYSYYMLAIFCNILSPYHRFMGTGVSQTDTSRVATQGVNLFTTSNVTQLYTDYVVAIQ